MRAKVDAARRFDPPFTATPNILFDWWMANLPNPEFLCLLYVYRRTYGFRRAADNISIDQFVHGIKRDDGTVLDTGTGLARSTVIKSLKALIEKGLIAKSTRHKVNGADAPSTYIVTKKITQNPITKGEGPGNGRYEGPGNGPTKERKESNTPPTPPRGARREEEDALRAEEREDADLFPEMDGDRWYEVKAIQACRGTAATRVRAGKLSDGQRMFLRRVLDSENPDWAQRRMDVLEAMRNGFAKGWDVTRAAMDMAAEIDGDGPRASSPPAQEEERPEPRRRRGGGAKSAPGKKRSRAQEKEDAYQAAKKRFLEEGDD